MYFTSKKVRDILFEQLDILEIKKPKRILEPSFGSGEFLLDIMEKYKCEIIGIEKDERLYKDVLERINERVDIRCMDFLKWRENKKKRFDLIIGNPPYYIIKKPTEEIKQYARKCNSGRINIYVLFLYKCIEEHLKENGIIAFILPTSFYNSVYYQLMRNYIYQNTTIKYICELDTSEFYGTSQKTMILILKKTKTRDVDYFYTSINHNVFLSPHYKELTEMTKLATNLYNLNFGVKIGNIVWNQIKDKLTDDDKQTLLIYSHNIKGSKFQLYRDHKTKKQYIENINKPKINESVILLSRGYGNTVCFDSVLIENKIFYAENHIIVIYPKNETSQKILKRVMKSLQDPKTLQFIKLFLGNGSLSITDVERNVPIFL